MIDHIDPLNLSCGCTFTIDGQFRTMCEEAGWIRGKDDLNAWFKHLEGSQPRILAHKRLLKLRDQIAEEDN